MYYEDEFIGWGRINRTREGWIAEGPVRSRVRKTIAAARLYVENQVREFMRIPRPRSAPASKSETP
jgi:hypothetical protein